MLTSYKTAPLLQNGPLSMLISYKTAPPLQKRPLVHANLLQNGPFCYFLLQNGPLSISSYKTAPHPINLLQNGPSA